MPQIQYRIIVTICALACLLGPAGRPAPAEPTPQGIDSTPIASAMGHSQKLLSRQGSAPVAAWFKRYDRIRRDAEMTLRDKLQSILLAATKPEKKNAALASRMIEKYATAVSEMNKLPSVAETRELQAGYITYFSTARQLFSDYREAQKVVPFKTQSFTPIRKQLEELDQQNKKLDAELRKQYRIGKHKHR